MQTRDKVIEKVTALITREGSHARQVLVFRHPHAGVQLPAGTVDPAETPEIAVRREVEEETGLLNVTIASYLGKADQPMQENQRALYHDVVLQSAPQRDATLIRATLQRGWMVETGDKHDGFVKVTWREVDNATNQVISQQSGWVPANSVADRIERHFYHLIVVGKVPDQWDQLADHGYTFSLFWMPFATAQINPKQQWWLDFARKNGL